MRVDLLGTGSADRWPNPWCRCDRCQWAREARVLRVAHQRAGRRLPADRSRTGCRVRRRRPQRRAHRAHHARPPRPSRPGVPARVVLGLGAAAAGGRTNPGDRALPAVGRPRCARRVPRAGGRGFAGGRRRSGRAAGARAPGRALNARGPRARRDGAAVRDRRRRRHPAVRDRHCSPPARRPRRPLRRGPARADVRRHDRPRQRPPRPALVRPRGRTAARRRTAGHGRAGHRGPPVAPQPDRPAATPGGDRGRGGPRRNRPADRSGGAARGPTAARHRWCPQRQEPPRGVAGAAAVPRSPTWPLPRPTRTTPSGSSGSRGTATADPRRGGCARPPRWPTCSATPSRRRPSLWTA